MNLRYRKPEIVSYSDVGVLDGFGACQNAYTVTLYTTTGNSAVNVDGNVYDDGEVIDDDGIFEKIVSENSRGLLGFDISSLAGRTIVSATLRVYQIANDDVGNTIIVDHIIFGNSMTADDYSVAALNSNIGTISNNANLEWKELNVKSYVQEDLTAGRTSSQYRFMFSASIDGSANFVDAEDKGHTGNRPELVVVYE